MYSLNIEKNQLVVKAIGGERLEIGRVSNLEEMRKLVEENGITDDDHFICSSTLDFPHEYTDNQQLIALCDLIRR